MPFRFYRRVPIIPGVRLNLSKSGASVSLGGPGAHVTFGRRGIRQTVGIPGTGMYYTHQSGRQSHQVRTWSPAEESPSTPVTVNDSRPAWIRLPLGLPHVIGWLLYAILWVGIHVIVLAGEIAYAVVIGGLLAIGGTGRSRRRW
jgi:Protein of unknown function (DUF4236)